MQGLWFALDQSVPKETIENCRASPQGFLQTHEFGPISVVERTGLVAAGVQWIAASFRKTET